MPKKKVTFVYFEMSSRYDEQILVTFELLIKSWGYDVKAFFWEAFKLIHEVNEGTGLIVSYDDGSLVQDTLNIAGRSIPVIVIYTRGKPEVSAPNLTLLQAPVPPRYLKQVIEKLLK